MKKGILSLTFILIIMFCFGQKEGELKAIIINKNNEKCSYADILLINNNDTVKLTTDINGQIQKKLKIGKYIINVDGKCDVEMKSRYAVACKSYYDTIEINENKIKFLNVKLEPDTIQADLIKYLDVIDKKGVFYCFGNTCEDEFGKQNGIVYGGYFDITGRGETYDVYTDGIKILGLKTIGTSKLNIIRYDTNKTYLIDDIELLNDNKNIINFIKENFRDGKLKEQIKYKNIEVN